MFAEHFGDTIPLCLNKCDNEKNDRDVKRRKIFIKTIQLKEQLLKKLLTRTSIPFDWYISYITVSKFR